MTSPSPEPGRGAVRPSRWLRRGLWALFSAALILNALAWRHAYGFTHFATAGPRTPGLERIRWPQKLAVLFTGARLPKPVNQRTPADLGLAYQTDRFPGSLGTTLEAWYVPAPDARGTVVLFHGHADCKQSLLAPAREFHRLGFATLLVDFHGSGGSTGDTTSIGWFEGDDVAAAFARARGRAPDPIVLYGESMGASAILTGVARHHLKPDAAILGCPFDRLRTTVAHRFVGLGLPPLVLADILLFWGGREMGFDARHYAPVDDARALAAPTLLMSGDADPWVTVTEARSIYEALAGPKQLTLFHGLRHQSYLAAQPAEWHAAVKPFLRGIAPRSLVASAR